jgi:AcrR family transcriptional regulator
MTMKTNKNPFETAPRAEASTKVDRRKAPKKKQTILDAAEAMFVQRGYYGSSLRDIALAAGVPQALVSYHFGSKEGLFRAVVERRAPANANGMRQALHEAIEVRSPKARLEAVLRAFIAPVVERSTHGGPGWKNYIRLMGHIANLPQQEAFVMPVPENYESVVLSFIDAIRSIYPHMSEADLQWSFYFYQAAIAHILIESGVIDRQTGGVFRSSELEKLMPRLVSFFSAGFLSLMKGARR